MPINDRKEVLKVLNKHAKKRKDRSSSHSSHVEVKNYSESSNNYSSSVKRQNWVLLHGKVEASVEDVWGIGKAIGVKYKGDKMNSFNLLSRAGRREWRAARGRH